MSAELTYHDHSIIACLHHIIYGCYSSRTSCSWWIAHSTQCQLRGCNKNMSVLVKLSDTVNVSRLLPQPMLSLCCYKKYYIPW